MSLFFSCSLASSTGSKNLLDDSDPFDDRSSLGKYCTSLMKILVEELHTEEVRIVLKALLVVVSVRGEKLNSGQTNIRWVLGWSVLQNECGEQILFFMLFSRHFLWH